MPFEFKLPDLGEGIHEAQVLTWKVAAGQKVTAFQPLVEVESAKAAVELTAPVAGRVLEARFAEGDTAHLGDVLVVLETTEGATPPPTRHQETSDGEWFGIVGSAPATKPSRPQTQVRAAPFVRRP